MVSIDVTKALMLMFTPSVTPIVLCFFLLLVLFRVTPLNDLCMRSSGALINCGSEDSVVSERLLLNKALEKTPSLK